MIPQQTSQGTEQSVPMPESWFGKLVLLFLTVALFFLCFITLMRYFELRQNNQKLIQAREAQQQVNKVISSKNAALWQEILTLKNKNYLIYEEWARVNYGYIMKGETFVHLPPERIKGIPDIPKLDALLKELNAQ